MEIDKTNHQIALYSKEQLEVEAETRKVNMIYEKKITEARERQDKIKQERQ